MSLPVTTVVADPRRPWKAVTAGVVAFAGLLWANLAGHQDTLGNLTVNEWVTIAVPTLLTFAATYQVPNPKVTRRVRDDTGHVDLSLLIGIACLVLLVVIIVKVL